MRTHALRTPLALLALAGLLLAPVAAEARFYGGFYDNNYPDVDWLNLETEHFIIHYYPEIQFTARMIAKYAEIAYPKVTGMFDFPLKEKVHIILRDMEENANGFAVYGMDWVTVWSTPLYYVIRGRQEWIPDCFTHEFSHIVSLKVDDWKSESAFVLLGSALFEDGVHNVDFGASVLIGMNTPYWWTEGIAEYGAHMSGFNWWTTSRDMHLRQAMLEDNELSYDEMFTPDNKETSFDREKGYQQGYSMALYVQEKYGTEKFAQMALNADSKGHQVWEKNIEDVLGIDGQSLYEGYRHWMKSRYERQAAPIRQAEHLGRQLFITSRAEEIDLVEKLPDGRVKAEIGRRRYEDPVPKDDAEAKKFEEARKKEKPKYEYLDKRQRKARFEKPGGSWDMIPRVSPDGKYTVYAGRGGVTLMPLPIEEWPYFTGRYLSEDQNEKVADDMKAVPGSSVFNGYDISPDGKKVLYSTLKCPESWIGCFNLDGYWRYDLFEYDIESEDVERLTDRLRAVYPSYSPDGQTIAFIHIEDGQNWLGLFPANAREVTIDGKCEIDGQKREGCVKWLIKKFDGTQIGWPSWSPDGTKIVFDLYRNHQQDIWMLNADGSDLHPLTWDRAEDRDGRFTPDGKHIVYVSDRTGIFNAYTMDLETREVRQLTNVLGGAYTPFITNNGDLLFSYFHSYGLMIYALKKDEFYNQVIDAGYDVSAEEVARNLAYEEPLPEIKEQSYSYNPFNPKNFAPIAGVPLFIYERDGIGIGGFVQLGDYLEKHTVFSQVLLGSQMDTRLFYVNNFWYPQFFLGWAHIEFGGEFSQGIDSSDAASPINPNDQIKPHVEPPLRYKYRQAVDFGMAGISYDFNPYFGLTGMYLYRYYTSKGRSDAKDDAFLTNNTYLLDVEYDGINPYGPESDVNPRGGRRMLAEYQFTRTGLPAKEFADVEWLGRTNPPGDHSDDYTFHAIELGYTEAIPVSWWNPDGQHTLEFHFRGGWINRNVHRWDEFFAGSLHPLRYVPTQSTTNEFAGYEDFSLGGETMLIFGLSYRFPFYRHIDRKFGPFYFASVWGEVFGTAGNLWGYTGEFVRDVYGNIQRNGESYWDPEVKRGTVRREVPFVDIATKNGNYMLYDMGFTLKLKGLLFGYLTWNSFVRVSYGLNDIVGQFETNDDGAFVDAYPNDAANAEYEPKSLRISIGIGSDFD